MPRTCKDAIPDEMFKLELEEPSKVSARADRRTNVRTELRDVVRDKLGEYMDNGQLYLLFTRPAESTGKMYIGMHWATNQFVNYIVRGEGHVVTGWPQSIPFGDPSYLPGGEKCLRKLLEMWKSGAVRWEKATEDELGRAVLNPVSVLPSTPLPPQTRSTAKERPPAKYVTGQLVMHRLNFKVVARPRSPPSDEMPPAKRPRVSGQRVDTNKARDRPKGTKPRNPKTGVKTPRYVRDDDALLRGFSTLDNDLGRLWDAGEVEVL